jgi:hypothetical protein
MHATSTPGRLDKIPLPLYLTWVEGRDEERPGDPIQGSVEAAGLLQVDNHRLDARTSKSRGLLSTPHQCSHWHTTRR